MDHHVLYAIKSFIYFNSAEPSFDTRQNFDTTNFRKIKVDDFSKN